MSVHSDSRAALQNIVMDVRRRWRTRRALNGVATASGVILIVFLITANVIGKGTPDQGAIMIARLIVLAAAAAAMIWFALRPLFYRVSDERVALYIEEREPSLRAALLGAVEITG